MHAKLNLPEQKVRELYIERGFSLRDIAKEYNCDPGVIARTLRNIGTVLRPPKLAKALPRDQLARLYNNRGLSTYAIAKLYNCDPKTVYRYLKLYEITPRSRKRIVLTKDALEYLYTKEGKSLSRIGVAHGYSPAGILKKMREFGIGRRSISETSTKHQKYDFVGTNKEKAYIIGFRLGDLGIRKRANLIYVSSGTTKDAQVNLICELFYPYGPIWIGNKGKNGAVNVSCSLNQSFSFLIPKHERIPDWIMESSSCFLSFLAGYTDAEGNFGVAGGTARFRLRSYDVGILKDLYTGLTQLGIHSRFLLVSKAGVYGKGQKRNKDCWGLTVASKAALHQLLPKLLPLLKHEKRTADARAALKNVLERLPYYT